MKPGLVSFADQLDKVALTPEPEPPPSQRTPPPMRTKVVSVASREPVNKQAALILARPPWWAKLEYDVPNRPPPTASMEELRTARAVNATLSDRICRLRQQNQSLAESLAETRSKLAFERKERQRLEQTLKQTIADMKALKGVL